MCIRDRPGSRICFAVILPNRLNGLAAAVRPRLQIFPLGTFIALATALTRLESAFDVQIITQNIDDLHERAGSNKVLHVHGEIRKARSTADPYWIVPIEGAELNMGDVCPRGAQLRPHIVWFGEAVPAMEEAILQSAYADIFIVTGTSLEVYPAASLLHYVPAHVEKYIVDPAVDSARIDKTFTVIRKKAGEGIPELVEKLLQQHVE